MRAATGISRGLAASVIALAVALNDGPSTIMAALDESRGGVVLYVDDDAPTGGDGSSWQTAIRFLQDALDIAQKPQSGVSAIRIAQGVYKPDQGANQPPGDIHATFLIPGGLTIRGGYAGLAGLQNGFDPDTRDWRVFESILSGDLLGNDGPPGAFENHEDNSHRVVTVQGADLLTTLDGVVIRAAAGLPAGGPPNQIGGGGLYCTSGQLAVSHCTFEANRAVWGGGAFLSGSTTEIKNCLFQRNRAAGDAFGNGGGLFASGGTQVTDSQFIENRGYQACSGAGAAGGHFTRCLFRNNYAGGHGGAILGGGQIIDCEFMNNAADEDGGAIYGYMSTIRGCTFRGNSAYSGGALLGIVTVINSRFVDNRTFGFYGSAFRGGGTLVNCEFIDNQALNDNGGGAVSACRQGSGQLVCAPAEFINCVFDANATHSVYAPGGGARIESGQTGTFINCTFTSNISTGDTGGAISIYQHPKAPSGIAVVRNCVLWNNVPGEINAPADVQYSCVQGGWPGEGNLSQNPQFVAPAGPDGIVGTEDDDLRLSAGSPCIDAADNSALPRDEFDLDGDGNIAEPLPVDLDGQPRVLNDPRTANSGYPPGAPAIVDMGAYEFSDFTPPIGDVDGDGIVNVDDLVAIILSWGSCSAPPQPCPADLDHDGAVNVSDLLIVFLHWG